MSVISLLVLGNHGGGSVLGPEVLPEGEALQLLRDGTQD